MLGMGMEESGIRVYHNIHSEYVGNNQWRWMTGEDDVYTV
jgi:hypothetical protein